LTDCCSKPNGGTLWLIPNVYDILFFSKKIKTKGIYMQSQAKNHYEIFDGQRKEDLKTTFVHLQEKFKNILSIKEIQGKPYQVSNASDYKKIFVETV
jgi:hypothetical protein